MVKTNDSRVTIEVGVNSIIRLRWIAAVEPGGGIEVRETAWRVRIAENNLVLFSHSENSRKTDTVNDILSLEGDVVRKKERNDG